VFFFLLRRTSSTWVPAGESLFGRLAKLIIKRETTENQKQLEN